MHSVFNTHKCRPVWMTSTCRPTPSMCWLLWPSFNKIKKRAPNHRSRLIRLQSRRPPPMNLSTIEGWETPHTTTHDNTFCSSENEPRRVYWDFSPDETFDSNEPRRVSPADSPSSTPPPPPRQKRRLSMGMYFPQKRGVSQHICEACGQLLPQRKTP